MLWRYKILILTIIILVLSLSNYLFQINYHHVWKMYVLMCICKSVGLLQVKLLFTKVSKSMLKAESDVFKIWNVLPLKQLNEVAVLC